jgi:glycine reductase
MDPENQDRIREITERYGRDNLIVVLGAVDPESLEVATQTVTVGDPSYVGSLAGVSLGLPVIHIFENDVKSQVDPAIYEEHLGLLELSLDPEAVKAVMGRLRAAG